MDKYIINGGKKLNGEIDVAGAKNMALKVFPATILWIRFDKALLMNPSHRDQGNRIAPVMNGRIHQVRIRTDAVNPRMDMDKSFSLC